MPGSEHYCLKWNNYQTNIVQALGNLKLDEDFVDVTLSVEGRSIKAHKVILSACSDYFRDVFRENPCQHPVVILRDASFPDLEGLVRYIYRGEVDVEQDRLQSFLRTAELLQIKGLADQNLGTPSSPIEQIKKEETSQNVLHPQPLSPSPLLRPQPGHLLSHINPSTPPTLAKTPPIKVPVPPTPSSLPNSSSSALKRSNFTNLAQYLSGGTGHAPSAISPPLENQQPQHKRRKTTPRRHETASCTGSSVGSGNGSGYLKQVTPPHYSGSTSSLTASPASPPLSHSTEEGSLEICEDTDRESARSTESTDSAPATAATPPSAVASSLSLASSANSAFKPTGAHLSLLSMYKTSSKDQKLSPALPTHPLRTTTPKTNAVDFEDTKNESLDLSKTSRPPTATALTTPILATPPLTTSASLPLISAHINSASMSAAPLAASAAGLASPTGGAQRPLLEASLTAEQQQQQHLPLGALAAAASAVAAAAAAANTPASAAAAAAVAAAAAAGTAGSSVRRPSTAGSASSSSSSSGGSSLKDGSKDSSSSSSAVGVAAQGVTTTNNNNTKSKSSVASTADHPRNRWRCMQPRVCPYCFKTFSNSFNLKQHTINVHIQSQGITCDICEKVVKNKWYLRKHLVTAHGAPLKRSKEKAADKLAVAAVVNEDDEEEEEIVVDDDVDKGGSKKKQKAPKARKAVAVN